MLKKCISALLILLTLSSQTVMAHGDGHHQAVNEKQAKRIALEVVKQFVQRDPGLGFGKLPVRWKGLDVASTTIHKKGVDYYIVQVSKLEEKKMLYVLMSMAGEVYDANFSGIFSGLE